MSWIGVQEKVFLFLSEPLFPDTLAKLRDVAQYGRAPGLGPGGRRFKPCRPDHEMVLYAVQLLVGIKRISLCLGYFCFNGKMTCKDKVVDTIHLRIK